MIIFYIPIFFFFFIFQYFLLFFCIFNRLSLSSFICQLSSQSYFPHFPCRLLPFISLTSSHPFPPSLPAKSLFSPLLSMYPLNSPVFSTGVIQESIATKSTLEIKYRRRLLFLKSTWISLAFLLCSVSFCLMSAVCVYQPRNGPSLLVCYFDYPTRDLQRTIDVHVISTANLE